MKIAIYTRKSIETDKGSSIENQIQICKDYFIRQNKECSFETFQDEGFTGGNTERPAFKRMMELVKAKKINVVAVYKLDRISRNIIDFFKIYEVLEAYKVEFVSVTEGFNPHDPMGRIMMTMLAGFADMERNNIRQRVSDNMMLLGKKGHWSGGELPLGYTSYRTTENGKKVTYLKLKEDEVELVKEIYSLYAGGISAHRITKVFNEKYNMNSSSKRIGDILKNPLYVASCEPVHLYLKNNGYNVYGDPTGKAYLTYGKTYNNADSRFRSKTNRIAAVSQHQPIIETSLWLKVQELLHTNTTNLVPPRKSQYTFLAHKVKCAKCSELMFVVGDRKRKDGTINRNFSKTCKCNTSRISVAKTEAYILIFLKNLTKRSELEKLIHTQNKAQDFKKDIARYNKQLSDKDKIINGLTEKLSMVSSDVMDVFLKKIESTISEKKEIQEKLLEIEIKQLNSCEEKTKIDILNNSIINFVENFNLLDIEEKQIQVGNIIEAIYYDSDNKDFKVRLRS